MWYELYTSLGLTDAEILKYLSGPAFLAWQRMGNIRGWGGPLDADWRKVGGMHKTGYDERISDR